MVITKKAYIPNFLKTYFVHYFDKIVTYLQTARRMCNCITHMSAHVTLKLLPKKWRVVDATRCSSRLLDCALSADDKYTDKLAPLVCPYTLTLKSL